jgi:hypothetical protein
VQQSVTPGGDIIVVVTTRDRAAKDQEQNFRQRMEEPPDIAPVIDSRKALQEQRERRDFSDACGSESKHAASNQPLVEPTNLSSGPALPSRGLARC